MSQRILLFEQPLYDLDKMLLSLMELPDITQRDEMDHVELFRKAVESYFHKIELLKNVDARSKS